MSEGLKKLFDLFSSKWTTISAIGSILLYFCGYLSYRFHLVSMGVSADLEIVNERYLFEGLRFLVYVITQIPTLILLVGFPMLVVYLLTRYIPPIRNMTDRFFSISMSFLSKPYYLNLLGIITSVIIIQLVMRHCLFLNNLLIGTENRDDWVFRLINNDPIFLHFFFMALLLWTIIAGMMLATAWRHGAESMKQNSLRMVFSALFVVQLIFLPVNYGYLIIDKHLPVVSDLFEGQNAPKDYRAWLVYEGKDSFTYLVKSGPAGMKTKALVTIEKKNIKNLKIIGYSNAFQIYSSKN